MLGWRPGILIPCVGVGEWFSSPELRGTVGGFKFRTALMFRGVYPVGNEAPTRVVKTRTTVAILLSTATQRVLGCSLTGRVLWILRIDYIAAARLAQPTTFSSYQEE